MRGSSGRAPLDRYDTPPFAVAALLREVPELRGRRLFDPCCGNGQMAQAVAKGRFSEVITNDFDPRTPTPNHHNFRKRSIWESVAPDWTVTNPPFLYAGECWNLAMDHSRKGVALLVRLSFLEVCKGRERLALCPPVRVIVLPRIKFRGRSSDSVTCAWMVWTQPGSDLSASVKCHPKSPAQVAEGVAA